MKFGLSFAARSTSGVSDNFSSSAVAHSNSTVFERT